MSDASAASAPSTPAAAPANAAPTAPNGQQVAQADDAIEVELDTGKVKIPLAKLNPNLAKYRSETDRMRSEYDREVKAHKAEREKLEAVLRSGKDNPDEVLRTLGHDPDKYAEAKLAAKVRAAMQADEEAADPSKKAAREAQEELERLRKERDELQKQTAEGQKAQTLARVKGFVDRVVAALPEAIREGSEADVIGVIRAARAEGKDITIEQAAQAVQKRTLDKLNKARALLGLPAVAAPKPAHPAAAPKPKPAAKPKANDGAAAGDILMDLQRGRF